MKKTSYFDARTVDSFVLKRDWGSPCWPWMTRMVSKIPQMFFYPFRTANGIALSISTGKWKYVNPCLDFLGIPNQRTAYVKRQVRPGWTYGCRSNVTLDLVEGAAGSPCRRWGSGGPPQEKFCKYKLWEGNFGKKEAKRSFHRKKGFACQRRLKSV